MQYFILIAELWILLLLCQLIGRRVLGILPTTIQNSIGFYIAPILGLSSLVLIATLIGWCTAFKFQLILPLTAILVIVAAIFERKPKQLLNHGWQICLFASICTIPIFAPIYLHGGYNPFTDIYTYLAHSQWLQTHAFSEKAETSGFFPYLSQISLYQTNGSRMGASFFFAYVQSLFHIQWSYNAYIPTVALAFTTGILALGGVIRQVVPVSKLVVLALAAIPCFSLNGYLFGAEWGFFPQTFGLTFAAGLAALLPALTQKICNEEHRWTKLALYAFPAAICTAALLFAYNEPFPLFSIALALYILIVCYFYKHKTKDILIFFSLLFLETGLLLNFEAIRIAKNLLVTISISKGAHPIGWPVLWSPIEFLAHAFGMKSSIPSLINIDDTLSFYIFPIIFVAVLFILFRFMQKNREKRLALLFLFTVNLVLFLFLIKFRYFSANASAAEVGQTFLQYKITKYAAPFSLAMIAIAFAILWYERQKLRPFFAIFYIALFGIALHYQVYNLSEQLTGQFIVETNQPMKPFQSLLMLRTAVENLPKDRPIFLAMGAEHHKLRQMVSYVLYDRKIASDYSDDGYIAGQLAVDQRVMRPTEGSAWITMAKKKNTCDESTHVVGPFEIHPATSPVSHLLLDRDEGGYNKENNAEGDSWNWVTRSISYFYQLVGSAKQVQFSFRLQSFQHPRKIIAELVDSKDRVLGRYELPQQDSDILFKSPWIDIDSTQLKLRLTADGEPARISAGDPREVTFVISNVNTCGR